MLDRVWVGWDVGVGRHWVVAVDKYGDEQLSRMVADEVPDVTRLVDQVTGLTGSPVWTFDVATVAVVVPLTVLWSRRQPVRYLFEWSGEPGPSGPGRAAEIAELCQLRRSVPVPPPAEELLTELRILVDHRAAVAAERGRTANRLRRLLAEVSVPLAAAMDPAGEPGWLWLLARFPRPRSIRRAGAPRLAGLLRSYEVGDPERLAAVAVAAAREPTGPCPAAELAASLVAGLAREVLALDRRLAEVDGWLADRFRASPWPSYHGPWAPRTDPAPRFQSREVAVEALPCNNGGTREPAT